MAFEINLGVTRALGKRNQWAWRLPIVIMQVYPVLLIAFIKRLPEPPRWSYTMIVKRRQGGLWKASMGVREVMRNTTSF